MNDEIRIDKQEALWMADRMLELAYRNDSLADRLEERIGESDSYTDDLRAQASKCRAMFKTIESRLDFDIEATWK